MKKARVVQSLVPSLRVGFAQLSRRVGSFKGLNALQSWGVKRQFKLPSSAHLFLTLNPFRNTTLE
jgi:hypothetical protein